MDVTRSLCVVLIGLWFAVPAVAQDARWQLNGPDSGLVVALAHDPSDRNVVHAATFAGPARSIDGGASWQTAPALVGRQVLGIAVAQSDPRRVYASSFRGLLRSDDRGVTWTYVNDASAKLVAVSTTNADLIYIASGGVRRSTDGGVTFSPAGTGWPANGDPTALVVDPKNHDIVYASFYSPLGVYKSTNGGASWSAAANSGLDPAGYWTLFADPRVSGTLYLGGAGHDYKSTDGGTTWTPLNLGVPDAWVLSFAMSNTPAPVLVAGTTSGVVKSVDGGATWSTPKLGRVTAVGVDPGDGNRVIAAYSDQLFRSTDGGAEWTNASSGLRGFRTQSIAIDPNRPGTVYAVGPNGTARSDTYGATWTWMRMITYPWVGVPLSESAEHIAIDNLDSNVLYVMNNLIVRSTDGGAYFGPFSEGLENGPKRSFVSDPHTSRTAWVVSTKKAYRSVGDGPWAPLPGLPSSLNASAIAIDPRSSSTIYVAGEDGSLFKSIDGATTWTPANAGLPAAMIDGVVVDPFDARHLFAWTSNALFESKNGAADWTKNAALTLPRTVLFDRFVPRHLWAIDGSNVVRSSDGGATWTSMTYDGRVAAEALAVSGDGDRVYTGGQMGGVWVHSIPRRRAVRP